MTPEEKGGHMADKLKHQEEQVFKLLQNGVFFDVKTIRKILRLIQESDFLREYTNPDMTFEALARTANELNEELQKIVKHPLLLSAPYGSGSGEGGGGGPEAGGGAPGSAAPSPMTMTSGDAAEVLEAVSSLATGSGFAVVGALIYLGAAALRAGDALSQ
jgi:hypothetical protein